MMQTLKSTAIALAAVTAVAGMSSMASAQSRDQIRIVGSSTVYPFASYVVEEFAATTNFRTPVIESTGSGGGIKLFCDGDDMGTPDISNASRRMKPSEFDRCQENGVTGIVEAVIGSDGIVIAQNGDNAAMDLNLEHILLAVAAQVPQDGKLVDNPYTNWNQIDASLPDRRIEILGPPSTSGTRDAFEELVMEAASESAGYPEEYSNVRQDGPWVDSGENDNLIVQRLDQNERALGVFGYSFLEENRSVIDAVTIDGVEPTPESISAGDYPVARSLFFYVKTSHEPRVEGMTEYVDLFMDDIMIGPDGLLRDIGLIALDDRSRERAQQRVRDRVQLQRADLED